MTLQVLVADEEVEALDEACRLVEAAGHEVVARHRDLQAIGDAVREHRPDLAVVALHRSELAVAAMDRLPDAGGCPTVVLLDDDDPELVEVALDRGVDAYAGRATPDALRSAIVLAQRRFGERRARGQHPPSDRDSAAMVEQAKGILMERHHIDADRAYALLRRHARDRRITVAEVAASVVRARELLPPQPHGDGAPSE